MEINKEKWIKFKPSRGGKQKLPKEKKFVLVQTQVLDNAPPGIAVGYMRHPAGVKAEAVWTIPGIGGDVQYWNDCLEDFYAPAWPGTHNTTKRPETAQG